jgi:hypothetical protein
MGQQRTEVCEFVAERFERHLVLIISDGERERWIARNMDILHQIKLPSNLKIYQYNILSEDGC